MEEQSSSFLNQIGKNPTQVHIDKSQFSINLFREEMYYIFYTRKTPRKNITLMTDVKGFKLIKQKIKQIRMINRLKNYGKTK
jgi:hypothetical protein